MIATDRLLPARGEANDRGHDPHDRRRNKDEQADPGKRDGPQSGQAAEQASARASGRKEELVRPAPVTEDARSSWDHSERPDTASWLDVTRYSSVAEELVHRVDLDVVAGEAQLGRPQSSSIVRSSE